MRKLKFRIPLKCNRCGKLGFDYQEYNGQQFMTESVTPCCDKRAYGIVGEPQQFTGQKDKQSTEIYEGDIVFDGFGNTSVVLYDEETAMFGYYILDDFGRNWQELFRMGLDKKVIGNVHQNPEFEGGEK